jgi:hypothetical protein
MKKVVPIAIVGVAGLLCISCSPGGSSAEATPGPASTTNQVKAHGSVQSGGMADTDVYPAPASVKTGLPPSKG